MFGIGNIEINKAGIIFALLLASNVNDQEQKVL